MNKKSADGRLSNNHPVERGDRVLTEAAVAVAGTKRDEFILQPGPCCGGEFGDDSRGPGAQRGPFLRPCPRRRFLSRGPVKTQHGPACNPTIPMQK